MDNLSEGELDALMGASPEGDAAAQAEAGAEPAAGGESIALERGVRTFDFQMPNTLSRGFERSLRSICESFSKIASLSLANQLRAGCVVSLANLRVCSFGEAYAAVENPSCIAVTAMPPLKGSVLLVLDAGITFSLFTRLLGGPLEEPAHLRDFTELETGMARRLVERLLENFRTAAERIVPLTPSVSQIENNPSYVQAFSDTEMVLTLQFSVGLDTLRGSLSLLLPLAAFEPVRGQFDPKESIELRGPAEKGRDRKLAAGLLHATRAQVAARFHARRTSLRELLALREGDVFATSHPVSAPLSVNVEGKHMFDAVPGRVGRSRAVRIVRRAKES